MRAPHKVSLKASLTRAWNFINAQRESQALIVVTIVGLLVLAASKTFEGAIRDLRGDFLIGDTAFYGGLLAITLLALTVYLFANRKRLLAPAPNLPDPTSLRPPGERLKCVPISNTSILDVTQRKLVPILFPGATQPDAMVYESFKRNSRRSIALYSDDEETYVGFATFWPIEESAAQAITAGTMSETEITVDHILPQERNKEAEYALVPAIAVLDAETRRGKLRALALVRGFRRFIASEFLDRPDRSMTVIATAYSDDGKRWCDALGMRTTCTVRIDGKDRPVCQRKLTAADLESLSTLFDD